jgi:DNA-binding GntR family transcriptional regulator
LLDIHEYRLYTFCMHDVNGKITSREMVLPSKRLLREKAYQYIQSKVLSGDFPGGVPISEVSISHQIGSSRTPVREAIGQLVSEGLLDQIPGRGTIVARADRTDIIDLYELREALEVYAVGKVARLRLHEPYLSVLFQQCEKVHSLAGELRRSKQERLSGTQMEQFVMADMGFHMLLLQAAGNRRIGKVVREARVLARIFSYRREGHNAQLLESIYGTHVDILNTIKAGNVTGAMEKVGHHIRASLRERLETYDRWERQHEMNRLIPLPPKVVEELARLRLAAEENHGSAVYAVQAGKVIHNGADSEEDLEE